MRKRKKKLISIVLGVFAMLTATACSGKDIAENVTKDLGEEEEADYRKEARVYKVNAGHEITDEEMEDLICMLRKRAEAYSTEAEVLEHTQKEERLIEIYIPEKEIGDEDYKEIVSKPTLEFISDYGTEQEKVWIENKHIEDVRALAQEDNGEKKYCVQLMFDEEGTTLFAEATQELLGETLYIVYDGEIISTPVIQDTITDGIVIINGLTSWDECKNMASLLRIGNLGLWLEEVPNPND